MATVSDNAIRTFGEWKLNKKGGKFFHLQLRNTEFVITSMADENAKEWKDFVDSLSEDQACFGVCKFSYTTKAGAMRDKVILVRWVPSECQPKDKMSYAMWSKKVKESLSGIHCIIQACSKADLEYESVLEGVSRFER